MNELGMEKIKKVVIFGGTHGDELSGVHLARKWKSNPKLLQDTLPSCPIATVISNPEAVKICRRYKDCDLNRQFVENKLNTNITESTPYEVKRAQEIQKMFADDAHNSFIIDLHNTTANMKCCLIVDKLSCTLSMHMAAYIQRQLGEDTCKILSLEVNYGSTRQLTKEGIGLEVGPQPQGVLRADICDLQERATHLALEFIRKYNEGFCFQSCKVNSFRILQRVPFPRNACGNIDVFIHQDLQDKDYEAISVTDPIFRTTDEKVLTLGDVVQPKANENELLYPVFVNEASYYEKDLAFWLTTKSCTELPSIQACTK